MDRRSALLLIGGRRRFAISPAVSGKSEWDLGTDGALDLGAGGTWTITPASDFDAPAAAWGGGSGQRSGFGDGGAAGAVTGTIRFIAGVAYTLYVATGGAGLTATAGSPGGGAGSLSPGGGGYSGLRRASDGLPVIIAAGGGSPSTGGVPAAGGAGGGATGVKGGNSIDTYIEGGMGGSQVAGGAGGIGASTGGSGPGTGSGVTGAAGSAYQGANAGSQGGAGGGGYFGGGAGAIGSFNTGGGAAAQASGGGGGSSYYNPSHVTSGVLYAGSGTTPGNNADGRRGTAGEVNANAAGNPGRVSIA